MPFSITIPRKLKSYWSPGNEPQPGNREGRFAEWPLATLTFTLGVTMLNLIRRNPLNAFLGTLLLAVAYQILFFVMASSPSIAAPEGVWAHILLVWVPVPLAGTFFFWAVRGLPLSRAQRLVQVFVASLLAPVLALAAAFFVWFVILGRSM